MWIPINISLKFAALGPINDIPAMVQIMVWRRSGAKPLSESMMDSLMTHVCVTRPQWVNVTPYSSVLKLVYRFTMLFTRMLYDWRLTIIRPHIQICYKWRKDPRFIYIYIYMCIYICIWARSRNCGCLVTWFCYQLIEKPGNKTATVPWPNPYVYAYIAFETFVLKDCFLNIRTLSLLLFHLTMLFTCWV